MLLFVKISIHKCATFKIQGLVENQAFRISSWDAIYSYSPFPTEDNYFFMSAAIYSRTYQDHMRLSPDMLYD